VYAAVFKSGNQTTTVSEGLVCNGFASAPPCLSPQGFAMPGGLPPPSTDAFAEPAPETGLIVKYNKQAATWEDELGRDWSEGVRFSLPDLDVFAIDASTLAETTSYAGVGTTLFNMTVNPVSGVVYVSNTEARNEVRFEGPGSSATAPSRAPRESRITILDGASVLPRHLNTHIDYDLSPAPSGTKDHSLATPVGMRSHPTCQALRRRVRLVAHRRDRHRGTRRRSFDSSTASGGYIPVSGGGPSGLVLDGARQRLYVLTRFDDAVSVIDLAGTPTETAHLALHNPSRRRSSTAGASSTTRTSPRATARRPARAATSSATWTTSPGTSATRTTQSRRTRSRSTSRSRSRRASSPCPRRSTAPATSTTSTR